jgi:hypothetical protein
VHDYFQKRTKSHECEIGKQLITAAKFLGGELEVILSTCDDEAEKECEQEEEKEAEKVFRVLNIGSGISKINPERRC